VKKKLLIFGLLAAALILGALYLWVPGTVPAGQPPLATLPPGNASAFERAFNADADSPRLVLMLSPT
jgi:hypothetical protein